MDTNRSEMSNVSPSKQSLDKLRCGWCKGYLSVAPISFAKGKFTCGRCNTNGIRISIYEELAKQTIFPCVYQNCKEKLAWGKAKQHEEHCHHKTIPCPVHNCQKTYELRTILQHFDKSHKPFVLGNPVKVKKILNEASGKNFKCDNKVFLTECQGVQFLIFVHSNATISQEDGSRITSYDYFFGVFSMSKTSVNFKYEVIAHVTHELPKVKRDQNVESFNDKVHCLNCFEATCTLKHHKKSRNFLTCKIHLVNLGDTQLTYVVKVYNENDKKPTVAKPPPPADHANIATNLECPICKEYMSAPIYNCANGHTLCKDCKQQITVCPFCKAKIGNSRNYVLEDISETVKIPCANASKGCRFSGSVLSTKDHETHCLYEV